MPFPQGSSKKIQNWFKEKGIIIPSDFIDKAELYNDLITSWSARMNIVSKNDLGFLLERHILDSLTPINFIPEAGRLIDIGSGGGFPAVPIALIRPRLEITLLESQHKKILFLKEIQRRLELKNISIVESRLEKFESDIPFDVATVRALPQWENYIQRIKDILAASGKIIYYEKRGEYRLIAK